MKEPFLQIEDTWSAIEGPTSIVDMALEQRHVHYPLAEHHYILAVIMHGIMLFGMKSVKIFSLFDSKVWYLPGNLSILLSEMLWYFEGTVNVNTII